MSVANKTHIPNLVVMSLITPQVSLTNPLDGIVSLYFAIKPRSIPKANNTSTCKTLSLTANWLSFSFLILFKNSFIGKYIPPLAVMMFYCYKPCSILILKITGIIAIKKYYNSTASTEYTHN
jgi:hypothetical protein